jgi:cob(I)alamin adenosyltransferase
LSPGLVIVNTGDGKGKTTAALGMVLRSAGHGMRVLVVQFVKSASSNTGELKALENLKGVCVRVAGLGFLNDPKIPEEKHRGAAEKALELVAEGLSSGEYDMVVADEILLAVKEGLLGEDDVGNLISARPENVHLVLTGRGCPASVVESADTVTEMKKLKHAYSSGVAAQRGVEY